MVRPRQTKPKKIHIVGCRINEMWYDRFQDILDIELSDKSEYIRDLVIVSVREKEKKYGIVYESPVIKAQKKPDRLTYEETLRNQKENGI